VFAMRTLEGGAWTEIFSDNRFEIEEL
jgi:hypothetical protein